MPCLKNADATLTDLIQHLVALVQDKGLDVSEGQLLVSDQRIQAAGSADDNVGIGLLVGQDLNILLHGRASVEHGGLDVREIFAESCVFVLDLIRQLTGVAHDEDGAFPGNGLQLVQRREDEDSSLSKTGLCLAQHVDVQDRGGDADLLDCKGCDAAMLDISSDHRGRKD